MDLMEARRRIMFMSKYKSKNLYNAATDTENAFWRANSPLGELVTNRSGYRASDFIRVRPNTTYTINYNSLSNATAAGMVFWNDNFGNYPVGGVALYYQREGGGAYTFTTPANCQYVTISTFPGSNNVQLELGQHATPYKPY